MNIKTSLQDIQDAFDQKDILLSKLEAKNSRLIKALSTIRQQLERSLKNPSILNESVYQSIDLCRANLVFLDYSTGIFKQDTPLSSDEKVLP